MSRGPDGCAPRAKNDPAYIAAAQELPDRCLDQMNSGRLPPSEDAKYDVSRQLEAEPTKLVHVPPLEAV